MAEPTLGEILAKLDGLDTRLTETREDAREARDRARDLTVRLGEQDLPTRIAELRGEMNLSHTGLRSDVVNAISRVATDVSKLDDRIKALEALREKLSGAGGVFGWLARNMPWLITVIIAVVAALGWGRHT